MAKRILTPTNRTTQKPDWLNIPRIIDSTCYRTEIYTDDETESIVPLAMLFYNLFSEYKNDLRIYSPVWGGFCLSTFNIQTGDELSTIKPTPLCKRYLDMCRDSEIDFSYDGFCTCHDWDVFLGITLSCVMSHEAPYSHVFCHVDCSFAFYFHHTSSIGLLYADKNEHVDRILQLARDENYMLEINNINMG